MKITQITNVKIEAEQNKWLYNGETFCNIAFLGVNDSVENWHEVTDAGKKELERLTEQNDKEPLN